MHEKKTVSIIGLGYVGLPLALLAAKKGYHVYGVDSDEKKVSKLSQRECTIVDDNLSNQPKVAENIEFTSDFKMIASSSYIVVCVPTPVDEKYMPDLSPVITSCESIVRFLQKGQTVIIESTINPGVCEDVILPILQSTGLQCGKDFYLAHCPERINPGDKKWNVENIPRVLGSFDEVGLEKAFALYSSVITGDIKKMASLKEAEAVKIVENSFRDINIAFVNELAMSFSTLGIDVVNVINGAATKPFSFMAHYPSCGVGGHCIPVDPYYLIEYAEKKGFHHEFLKLARNINNGMPQFTVSRFIKGMHEAGVDVRGSKVALLGLAYKPDIEDCRESPAFKVLELLKKEGVIVETFDPYVIDISTKKSLEEVLKDVDAVVITTAHAAFKQLLPQDFIAKGIKLIIDGNNCLPKQIFETSSLIYKGIGR